MLEIKFKPESKEAENENADVRMDQKEDTGAGTRKRRSATRNGTGDDTPGKNIKGSHVVKKGMIGVCILFLAVILTFGFSLWSEYARKDTEGGKQIEVTIAQGSSTRDVGAALKDAGVIRYEIPFLVKMYFSDYKGKLRYGTFRLSDSMSLDSLIKALATGGALKEEAAFTIPEGYSVKMIANKLEKEGIMSADEFLTAVENAAGTCPYAQNLPEKDRVFYQLEGYLFPDTYYLSENMTGDELVQKILEEFQQKFDQSRQEAATAAGMSVEEVLIRASLVQKETERPEEYPTVAGVINNRLAQNMNLQFDSTVVYAMTGGLYGVERVLYDHLKTESPYNTYLNKGLPVGPICNPSLEAIDGVLHPEENEYLYFQTDAVKNDGSNLYFKTYEEHAAAAATTQDPSAQQGETTAAEGQ